MGLSFHETMQGTLRDRWGRDLPIAFTVKAEAPGLRRFLGDGRARLTGVVHAPPLAADAPLAGTITIRPLPLQGQFIRYDFTFGDRYRFVGEKRLSVRRPLATVCHLEGEVRDGDDVVARGALWFNLDEVAKFAASASWATDTARLPLAAATPVSPPSPGLDRVLFAAFADAVVTPGGPVPPVDDATVDAALAVVGDLDGAAAVGLHALLRAIDAIARARHARGFAALDRDARVALLDGLEAIPGVDGPAAMALAAAAMPIRAAHFDRADFLAAIGAPSYVTPVREPAPDWTRTITTAEDLDADTRIDCDVVVIGTGAGGGAAAAALAERGLAVAVLEEGRWQGRTAFQGSPLARMRHLWRDAGLTFSVGNTPISLPQGKMIGGTTAINSGTCFRAPEAVFEDWRRLGLSDATSSAFDPWYAEVERELEVAVAPAAHLGAVADVIRRGADALGLANAPLPRNAPGCDGQGACIFGCPTDAKRSSNVSWIPRAARAGAGLFTGLPVTRLLRRGRSVVAVEARGPDAHGVEKRLRVHARFVVVACGALGTPRLLLQNGFDLPMLGHNLSVHPELGMWGRLDRDVAPWAAIPQSYGIHGLEGEGIKFEGIYVPPQLAAAVAPLSSPELTRWLGDYGRVVQYGFMVKDPGNGRVRLGPDGKVIVRYDVDPGTHAKLQRGAAVLAEVLIRGGCHEVMPGIRRQAAIHDVAGAQALASAPIRVSDWTLLGSHPLGTARIGASPRTAVCDPEHVVFGTDNLFVLDGAAVPTSLGVNPQLTIMAMALRGAAGIAARA